MDDLYDSYIRWGIKNWAARYRPLANGRQRLLEIAALPPEYQDHSAQWLGNDISILAKEARQKPYEKPIEVIWMLYRELTPLHNLA